MDRLTDKGFLKDNTNMYTVLQRLSQYEDAEENGLLLKLPCKIGATVYVITQCKYIKPVPDGTLYDSDGGYGTATGYYCPYDLNEKCPHVDCDCDEAENKTAVYEDTIEGFYVEMFRLFAYTHFTGICGEIGKEIFLTKEEAERALAEREA